MTACNDSNSLVEGVPFGGGIEIDPSTGNGLRERSTALVLPLSSFLLSSRSNRLPSNTRATRSRSVKRLYGSTCCTFGESMPCSLLVSIVKGVIGKVTCKAVRTSDGTYQHISSAQPLSPTRSSTHFSTPPLTTHAF